MGKVASRFWTKGYKGGFGSPQAHTDLEHLVGWSREKLERSYRTFCSRPSLGVDLENFAEILQFDNIEDEHAAFQRCNPKKGKVDMLSIFAAMIATSNQRFISRVSFLFSIFDLDGNGSINGAEFYIAVSGMMKGISLFFESAVVPSKRDLEDLVSDIFNRIDADESGYITLGELLCFAYRSRELRLILEPFPASDQRIFEDALVFSRTPNEKLLENLSLRSCAIEEKLKLSPESWSEGSGRGRRASISFRDSAVKKSATVTKGHCWFLYEVFLLLAGGRFENTIPISNIRDVLANSREIEKVLEQVAKSAGVVLAPRERLQSGTRQRKMSTVPHAEEGISGLVQHIRRFFSDSDALLKLDLLGEGNVSLRAFLCVLLFRVPENEIEMCLKWCGSYRARDVLITFLDSGDIKHGLVVNDVRAIFRALDRDNNGSLSVDELMEVGTLTEEQAQSVLHRLDVDHNGTLSAEELQGILFSMDTTLRTDLRNVFAGKSGAEPPSRQVSESDQAP